MLTSRQVKSASMQQQVNNNQVNKQPVCVSTSRHQGNNKATSRHHQAKWLEFGGWLIDCLNNPLVRRSRSRTVPGLWSTGRPAKWLMDFDNTPWLASLAARLFSMRPMHACLPDRRHVRSDSAQGAGSSSAHQINRTARS